MPDLWPVNQANCERIIDPDQDVAGANIVTKL